MSQTPDLPEQTPAPEKPTDLVPTRVLWFSFGTAAGLAVTVASVAIVWGAGGTTSLITSLVSSFTSIGLFAAAIWAATTGVHAMQASREASRAAMIANEQAERDSRRAHRPYIGAEAIPGLAGTTAFDLRITNYGKTAARDLTIECVPGPDRRDDVTEAVQQLFSTPRTMFPNASIRTIWRLIHDSSTKSLDSKNQPVMSDMGMPERATLTLTYTDDDRKETFTDTIEIMCYESGLWPVPATGIEPKNGIHTIKHLHSVGKSIARLIGEISR